MCISHPTDLPTLIDKSIRDFRLRRGFFPKLGQWICNCVFTGPRAEIAHDWQTVWEFASRAEERLKSERPDAPDKQTLATVLAYLECARQEHDFAQAWTYVNLADALLPLIVSLEELDSCTIRLRNMDRQMEGTSRDLLPQSTGDICEKIGQSIGSAAPGDLIAARYKIYADQLARALAWNDTNRNVSLKLALWRSIVMQLMGSLIAIFAAVLLWNQRNKIPPVTELGAVALLGLFGGTLSAFLTARDSVVNIPSYELIKTHTYLRMCLGAAGSLVVYIVWMWLLSDKLNGLRENAFTFMSLGIVAGFSERLFIAALEKAATNLQLTGTTKTNS